MRCEDFFFAWCVYEGQFGSIAESVKSTAFGTLGAEVVDAIVLSSHNQYL
jgi:hypothetical protein